MHIVVLTGAGISAESGINTFRAADGLWENHRIEDVATPEGFALNPERVHRFYNERRAALKTVKPNPAHIALADLHTGLTAKGGRLTVVTQNVDDLHERGGLSSVIHMHGELTSNKCTACNHKQYCTDDSSPISICAHCQSVGTLRPDIVWFGEMPYHMNAIEAALYTCDLFVSIGTSGAVYPAAGFVNSARNRGIQTLELNLEPSEGSHLFHESRLGKAGDIVPVWVKSLL